MKAKATRLSKKSVLHTLKDLPDPFLAEDLIERILLLQKVERGLADVQAGRTKSQGEVKEALAQRWSK
jgi:hypothetical protein